MHKIGDLVCRGKITNKAGMGLELGVIVRIVKTGMGPSGELLDEYEIDWNDGGHSPFAYTATGITQMKERLLKNV